MITGPGLGIDGIPYAPQTTNPSGPYVITNRSFCSNLNTPYCVMNSAKDSSILAIPDNAPYTVTVYDASNSVLASYTMTLPKRPFTNAELSAVAFPAITQESALAFLNYNDGAITLNATMPAGVTRAWGYLGYKDSNQVSKFIEGEGDVVGGIATMSTNFTIAPATIYRLEARVSYRDVYQREIMTNAVRGY